MILIYYDCFSICTYFKRIDNPNIINVFIHFYLLCFCLLSFSQICFKCSAPKSEQCINLNSDPFNESAIASDQPSATLVVKGLLPMTSEEVLSEVMTQSLHHVVSP